MRIATPLVIALALTAISTEAADAQRRFLPGRFVLEHTIGDDGSVDLFFPHALGATPEGNVVIFDDGQVRAFTPAGAELWKFGAKGSGPKEFRGVRDLMVDRNGDVLVLDEENQRITRLSADGAFKESVPLRGATAYRLLPTLEGTSASYHARGQLLWEAIGGTNPASQRMPATIQFSHDLAGEAITAGFATGSVLAFRWSSRIVFMDAAGRAVRIARGIEEVEFPEVTTRPVAIPGVQKARVTKVAPDAVEATIDIAATPTRTYVLFAGRTEDNRHLLDVYENSTGRYLGSHRLPMRAVGMAVLPDGRIATLEKSMVPVIKVWRIE